jgi:DNA-binding MarR family transcriptional regulator
MATASPKPRAELTAKPAETAFRALLRIFGLLERVMQPYFARFGISGSQWGVLRTLHRAEASGQTGLRLIDLSDRLLIRPPSVTGVVDRLQRAGLVVRDGSPTDLRAKHVMLTDAGRQLVERVLAVHPDQIASIMSGLSTQEQAQLEKMLSGIGRRLEEMALRGPAAEIA